MLDRILRILTIALIAVVAVAIVNNIAGTRRIVTPAAPRIGG